MEWIIILRSLIELIAQLQFSSAVGQSDGIASVQSGSRLPICLLYSNSSGWQFNWLSGRLNHGLNHGLNHHLVL